MSAKKTDSAKAEKNVQKKTGKAACKKAACKKTAASAEKTVAGKKASKKIKAAILGFGGMGHCHASQYAEQKDVELVAVCDIDPAKMELDNMTINIGNTGKTETGSLHKYLCYEDLIKGEPDLAYIDICLPTDLHCEYAVRAMQDGFNVLCEKPMALNSKDAEKMLKVSRETGKFLMIAQCLRFGEDFNAIKKAYDTEKYGKLLRLSMRRVGGFPGGWFRDVKRSGGALMDLHLHDIDFIIYMLGMPESLICYGSTVKSGGIDDSISCYCYPDGGPQVSSEGSWARANFAGTVAAVFEEATMEIGPNGLTIYQMDKPVKTVAMKGKNMYFNEIAYFAKCVKTGRKPETSNPESTLDTIRIIELEEKSAKAGGKKIKL